MGELIWVFIRHKSILKRRTYLDKLYLLKKQYIHQKVMYIHLSHIDKKFLICLSEELMTVYCKANQNLTITISTSQSC